MQGTQSMIRFALFLAILAFPISAQADVFVVCLQKQLTQLSVDVGVADGLFGSRTKKGVEEIVARRGTLGSLPKPTKENASVWCKELGAEFDLVSIWPSSVQKVHLEVEETVSREAQRLLNEAARETHEFLLSKLEVEIPGVLALVGSTTMGGLVSLTTSALQGAETKQNIRRKLKAQCGNRDYISGASYGGVVALCPNRKLGEARPWTGAEKRDLRRLISHEMSHEIHTQLVGNYRRAGGGQQEKARGPKWLVEGVAIALELAFAVPELSAAEQVLWFEKQQGYDGNRLKRLSKQSTQVDRNFQLYAGYAGVLLASKHSHRAIGEFWEATPELGWEKSFERAFDQSIDDFYLMFGRN